MCVRTVYGVFTMCAGLENCPREATGEICILRGA